MRAFRFLSFSKVCWEMRFLKNWPFSTDAFWMAPLFNIVSTSFVTGKGSCADIFGWCGAFSWNVSKMKSVFRPATRFKISGLLVNFSQFFTKYRGLPARGKFLTFTFGNKFWTIGYISLKWCNGAISSKFLPEIYNVQ